MPGERRVVIGTHGHCFDGAASAALFCRLLAHLEPGPFAFEFVACGYGPDKGAHLPSLFHGELNALLDFRFASSPHLTWYFDHHLTAFEADGARAAFEAHSHGRYFHDSNYGSCTKLIADVSSSRFGFHDPMLDELVRWADLIDAARFPNPQEPVDRTHPVLQLMTVIEHHGDSRLLASLVPKLAAEPVDHVAKSQSVQKSWMSLRKHHQAFVVQLREKSALVGRVVVADMSDRVHEVAVKFVTYAQFPQSAYSVILSRARSKLKISVGFNPWSGQVRTHDISAICGRFGGGGHAVVGAIALHPDQLEKAHQIIHQIVGELNE